VAFVHKTPTPADSSIFKILKKQTDSFNMTNIDFENGFLRENHACVKKPLNKVLKEINLSKNERIIANLTLLKK